MSDDKPFRYGGYGAQDVLAGAVDFALWAYVRTRAGFQVAGEQWHMRSLPD